MNTTIQIQETNPFKVNAAIARVQKFADLDSDTQKKLETLSQLDNDTLNKLVEVAQSPKLVNMFQENWDLIKSM